MSGRRLNKEIIFERQSKFTGAVLCVRFESLCRYSWLSVLYTPMLDSSSSSSSSPGLDIHRHFRIISSKWQRDELTRHCSSDNAVVKAVCIRTSCTLDFILHLYGHLSHVGGSSPQIGLELIFVKAVIFSLHCFPPSLCVCQRSATLVNNVLLTMDVRILAIRP